MSFEDPFIAAARRLLDDEAKKPPAQRFARLVRLGMIDKEGRLTKFYGGTAEAEIGTLFEAAALLTEPLDRLIWVLRGGDSVCLDGPTARRLTGASSLEELVRLINAAVSQGLVERWSNVGAPSPLDAVDDKDKEIGARLTKQGKAHAKELEERRDAALPLEAFTR